ncbi:MAG TPA: histidine kinase [Iamia sp.]|nr:histidine kinase [Iamia sp.]
MVTLSPPVADPHPLRDRVTRLLPLTVDVAVVGGVGLCALFDLIVVGTRWSHDPLAIAFVTVLLAAVRRWAALPAIIVLAAGMTYLWGAAQALSGTPDAPKIAPMVAVAALSTTAVRRLRVPWAATAVAAGALTVLTVSTWPMEPMVRILFTLGAGGVWALGVGGGLYLRHLDDSQVQAAHDARRAERLDLARELHDLVAHYVTGIVVQAQAAQVVADRDPTAAGAALDRIEGAGRDALGAMRTLVGSLRAEDEDAPTAPPPGLVALDGLAGLSDLVERSRATGLPVTVTVTPDAARAAHGAAATSIHRIVQESLTNVHRHAAEPTRAEVDVRLVGTHLVVTVTDDGRQAGDADRTLVGAGFGLVGMAERAHALAGSLTAGPLDPPAHGWRVQATLPVVPG